jgi:hypothetical protein
MLQRSNVKKKLMEIEKSGTEAEAPDKPSASR